MSQSNVIMPMGGGYDQDLVHVARRRINRRRTTKRWKVIVCLMALITVDLTGKAFGFWDRLQTRYVEFVIEMGPPVSAVNSIPDKTTSTVDPAAEQKPKWEVLSDQEFDKELSAAKPQANQGKTGNGQTTVTDAK